MDAYKDRVRRMIAFAGGEFITITELQKFWGVSKSTAQRMTKGVERFGPAERKNLMYCRDVQKKVEGRL